MKKTDVAVMLCLWLALSLAISLPRSYAQDNVEQGSSPREEKEGLRDDLMEKQPAFQSNEALIKETARLKEEETKRNAPITFTRPVDIAFRQAMDKDLSFGVGEGRTQMEAVRAWEEIVKREDISDRQRVFALWRMGCLLSYNMDPARGEVPDMGRASTILKEAMNVVPGLLSKETTNAATVFASSSIIDSERAERLGESYRFLKTATPKMYAESAALINKNGYALDKEFFPNIARLPPASQEETSKWLNKRMARVQQGMEVRITKFFESCNDEVAERSLLKILDGFADPDDLRKWHALAGKFGIEWDAGEATVEDVIDTREVTAKDRNAQDAKSAEPAPLPPSEAATSSNSRSSVMPYLVITASLLFVAIGGTMWWFLSRKKAT